MIKNSIGPKNPNNLIIKNGEYTILFSETFNMYENTLSISGLFKINMLFSFEEDKNIKTSKLDIVADSGLVKFTFFNFHKNPLGVCTTDVVKINGAMYSEIESIVDGEKSTPIGNKQLYFSAHVKNISEASKFFMFSLSFYIK